MLVQILIWGYLGSSIPRLFLGLPFTGISVASAETERVIGASIAAILALGLNEAAYAAELVRAGIISVDKGQMEAAASLGMSPALTMRRIILPQAMRVIIPPMGNETISMLKTTSLVYAIAGEELLTSVTDHLLAELHHHPAAPGGLVLVHLLHDPPHDRAALPRGVLRQGFRREGDRGGRKEGPEEGAEEGPEWTRLSMPDSRARPSRLPRGQPMVKAEQVWKSFGKLDVLKGIDFVVYPQQTFVLLGPSGGGKSTLLRCINHLEKIDAGRLWVDGELMGYRERGGVLHEMHAREVAAQRAKIGMVFQRFNLFPHMTAIENVMEAPRPCPEDRLAGRPKPKPRRCSRGWA